MVALITRIGVPLKKAPPKILATGTFGQNLKIDIMRKFIFLPLIGLAFTIFLSSCSNDRNDNYRTEFINVIEAELPNEFEFGNFYNIDVDVEIPSSCYTFYDDFNYVYNGDERLIFPIAFVDDDGICTPRTERSSFTIRLQALQRKPYVFKFYQGLDSNGDKIYLTYTVPVSNRNQMTIDDFDTNNNKDGYH